MAKTLDIAQLGDPILRSPTQPVTDLQSPRLQTLIEDLIATAALGNGVGIAAPQVSRGDRLFIIASRPTLRYPQAPTMAPTPMINPEILGASEALVQDWEGCLSVPGIRGLVLRHQWVEVEYCDRQGQRHQQKLTDFVARIFQHELDHLNGIVFLDRVECSHALMSETEYQNESLPGAKGARSVLWPST
ncbi:MAG: peptide deformylase [Oscillatoriales cyanobacterium RM2_1_1]|nr:peptide deformylase [Oscillatoriales cyanobacterium RM2_1_1]